jgi:hypothetical protein
MLWLPDKGAFVANAVLYVLGVAMAAKGRCLMLWWLLCQPLEITPTASAALAVVVVRLD